MLAFAKATAGEPSRAASEGWLEGDSSPFTRLRRSLAFPRFLCRHKTPIAALLHTAGPFT